VISLVTVNCKCAAPRQPTPLEQAAAVRDTAQCRTDTTVPDRYSTVPHRYSTVPDRYSTVPDRYNTVPDSMHCEANKWTRVLSIPD
jgi:hypothetical protein